MFEDLFALQVGRRDRLAGRAHQVDLGLAHPGNPHVVGDIRPFEQLLLADAGLRCEYLAPLDGAGGLEQPVGGAYAKRFQFRRGEGRQASNLGDRVCHDTRYEKKVLNRTALSGELA